MPFKLAFMTVGIMREPYGHTQVQGFLDRVPAVYNSADSSDGFHGRSIRDLGTWLHSWGEITLPACYPASAQMNQVATTLSLWKDLESVAAFSYHGPHGEALTKRRDWFDKDDLPVYVAWWIPEEQSISWPDGCARIDHLHAHGPTAFAFDFAHPFDPAGNPCRLDREAVKAKAALNAEKGGPAAAMPMQAAPSAP
jgi:hypothetical protein